MNFKDIPQITTAHYSIHVPWDYLESALENYKEDFNLQLEPEFQRSHVWTEEQQSRYVEWILCGGKTGKEIYFNSPNWGREKEGQPFGPMVLVDGLQRITAVLKFLRNELPAFGHTIEEYEGKPHIIHNNFIFYVNDLEDYADVLKWYLDINSGGTQHTEEELAKVKALWEKEVKDVPKNTL